MGQQEESIRHSRMLKYRKTHLRNSPDTLLLDALAPASLHETSEGETSQEAKKRRAGQSAATPTTTGRRTVEQQVDLTVIWRGGS
eukprot:649031-Hanusia_phi.AAC.1